MLLNYLQSDANYKLHQMFEDTQIFVTSELPTADSGSYQGDIQYQSIFWKAEQYSAKQ